MGGRIWVFSSIGAGGEYGGFLLSAWMETRDDEDVAWVALDSTRLGPLVPFVFYMQLAACSFAPKRLAKSLVEVYIPNFNKLEWRKYSYIVRHYRRILFLACSTCHLTPFHFAALGHAI